MSGGTYEERSVGNGRYQLRSLLGEGGMASVHLAHDTVLDRSVAVKTLHTNLGTEPSFRERFRREAQSVAKLNHTNIVSVFDSGEDTMDGVVVPYIVMEYVEGKPLGSVLAEDVAAHGAMPTEKALKITRDVLAALSVSHEMGLVHRDIKPGNVMLTKRGVVKVMDFGIARAMQSGVTSMTQTGMVVGTPQYLSPEQALGRAVDERSDLYSVGCLLFELLTGRLPFDGDSPLAMAYQHVQEIPGAPSEINRSLPPAVDALVSRALKKNPQERFPTAEVMEAEVARIGSTAQSVATPLVISEGPRARNRGADVSAAVFPPVQSNLRTPPPYVQQPYQPQQQSFGPSTPPPMYLTPPPPLAQQRHTPPPAYTIQQGPAPAPSRRGGGPSLSAIVIGASLVVIFVVLIVIANVTSGGKDEGTDDRPTATAPVTETAAPTEDPPAADPTAEADDPDVVQGDKNDTISVERCTNPTESSSETGKVYVPDFEYKYIDSVTSCLKAAGWKYELKYENEVFYGKGTVIRQTPDDYDLVDPGKSKIVLTVSTGKAG